MPTPLPTRLKSQPLQETPTPRPVGCDKDGPHSWFSENILPHEPALRSWLRARFPSLADSDDIVQESYVRMLHAPDRGRIANARAYLFSTARNLVLDLFRRRHSAPVVDGRGVDCSEVPEDRTGVREAVSAAQEFELLTEAIDSLPERCRAIMVMQKLQGLSNAVIAERLNLSINTVNAQLVIGLARCRTYLSERGVLRGNKR